MSIKIIKARCIWVRFIFIFLFEATRSSIEYEIFFSGKVRVNLQIKDAMIPFKQGEIE